MSEKNKKVDFRDALTRRRAEIALEEQNKAFAAEHTNDTEEQLLEYLRASAKEIGHSPNACEVIGGFYILARFGSWQRGIAAAGLKQPGPAPKWENRLIVRRERNRQWELFLAEKSEARKQKEVQRAIKEQKLENGE